MQTIILGGITGLNVSFKSAGHFAIANILRRNGYSCQVINIAEIADVDTLLSMIDGYVKSDTLWIGISNSMLNTICGKHDISEIAFRLMDRYQAISPNVRFLIAGNGNSFGNLSKGWYRFQGFTEREIIEFTDDCVHGRDSSIVTFNKEFTDFHSTPVIYTDQDVMTWERYLPLEVSRGCIFRCAFCSFPLNGKKKFDYIKDEEALRTELVNNWENFGITNYSMTDDTFNDSMFKLERLKSVLDSLPFKIRFVCYLRLDLLMRHRDMIPLLRDMGLVSCQVGIETMDLNNAKLIGKGVPFEDQISFIRELRTGPWADITINSNFIVGFPYDTMEGVDRLIDWQHSKENPLDDFGINALGIIPLERKNSRWYSEFDQNYKDHGYYFPKEDSNWINLKSGLDFVTLNQKLRDYNATLRSITKFTGFYLMAKTNLGIPIEDMLIKTKSQIREEYDVDAREAALSDIYIKEIVRRSGTC